MQKKGTFDILISMKFNELEIRQLYRYQSMKIEEGSVQDTLNRSPDCPVSTHVLQGSDVK